jgi:hypothetical protein
MVCRVCSLESKRDSLAAEFREVYPEFEAKVVDLPTRMAANDIEIANLHIRRSSGVKLHLLEAELMARDLDCFTRDVPSIGIHNRSAARLAAFAAISKGPCLVPGIARSAFQQSLVGSG